MSQLTGGRVVLSASNVSMSYDNGRVTPLRSAELRVPAGVVVAVTGPSGTGKSTLLNILGLLDRPTSGRIEILGTSTEAASPRQRRLLRARHVGFMFQNSLMDPARTSTENLLLALDASGIPRAARRARIEAVLKEVGLSHLSDARARTLSGGERQRLAIARAVVHTPAILLCDEPTGNLDRINTNIVFDLIRRHVGRHCAALLVTHDLDLASRADRQLELQGGTLETVR